MVTQMADLDAVFHALASPVRRDFLVKLGRREMSVSELRSGHDMSLAAASKHVRVLQDAGMVARRLRGRDHLCRIRPDVLRSASAWLLHYEALWSASLDRLAAVLEESEA